MQEKIYDHHNLNEYNSLSHLILMDGLVQNLLLFFYDHLMLKLNNVHLYFMSFYFWLQTHPLLQLKFASLFSYPFGSLLLFFIISSKKTGFYFLLSDVILYSYHHLKLNLYFCKYIDITIIADIV